MRRNEKKILLTAVVVILLLGVMVFASKYSRNNLRDSGEESTSQLGNKNIEQDSNSTQEELDEELRKEAVRADFVEINGDNVEEGAALMLIGEVGSIVHTPPLKEFMLTTEEDDGYGVYLIKVFSTLPNVDSFDENDNITIYGRYQGRDNDTGVPTITSTVVENR